VDRTQKNNSVILSFTTLFLATKQKDMFFSVFK